MMVSYVLVWIVYSESAELDRKVVCSVALVAIQMTSQKVARVVLHLRINFGGCFEFGMWVNLCDF